MSGTARDVGSNDPVLRPAMSADLDAVERLLEAEGLPVAGVSDALEGFLVAEAAGGLVGVAGLERHGVDGVLRSVAVTPSFRSRGLGGRLTERVLDAAAGSGIRRVYLLTTTAADYFPRYGFRPIEREDASPAVQESVEFLEACPASAVTMVLDLEERDAVRSRQ